MWFLTSLSLVRTGCSLIELLTTYCSKGSSFPLLWLFPIKADFPNPDRGETERQLHDYQLSVVCQITHKTTISYLLGKQQVQCKQAF